MITLIPETQGRRIVINNAPFPVIYSTLSIPALMENVLCYYPLEHITNCQLWHRGLSDIYLIETLEKPYILRVSHHHWRTQTDIDFELQFLNFLKSKNIPVSAPIPTLSQQVFIPISAPEGTRYASLFDYAQGSIPLGDFTINQAYQLGKTLAFIHQSGLEFQSYSPRQPLTFNYLIENSLQEIIPFLKNCPQSIQYLEETCHQIEQKLENLPKIAPFWTVCWGDPHSGNVHFTPEGKLTLFDFDQCGYGWRAFDIAKFLQISIRTGIAKKVRESFLSGYQNINPLTEIEINSLQILTQTAHIWAWAISVNSTKLYDYSRLNLRFFQDRLEQLKRFRSKDWQLF